ncbi:MAG: hypothetical protein Q8K72_02900, partial [Acidimicrobiales bacterium]|nr:hypothetical protein [Acidimicrobiales bacterium]
ELPVTTAAHEAGELCEDQVAVIARHAPAGVDAELARAATVTQLRRVLGSYPFAEKPAKHPGDVADAPKVITAEQLDAMSPDQRAQVVRDQIVTDLDHLPAAFRQRVETTAARLAEQLRPVTE